MRRILYLLVFMEAIWAEEDYTLLDIIPAHSTLRLFDTLSASVAHEYEGRASSFDASLAPVFEKRPINLNQLNKKYRDYLYQGDMLISPERLEHMVQSSVDGGKRRRRKAYLSNDYPKSIWRGGIPYAIHRSISAQARDSINRAIAFWQDATCIEFRNRTTEKQYLDFIGNDDGCWSTVGKDDSLGRQVVSIGKGCEHVAHALGVFHEQSRWDRDEYVKLNTKVVSSGQLFNFAKEARNLLSTYQLPYDIGSVMHYSPTELSERRGIPALTAVDPNLQQTMGQLEGPSFLDVAIINEHYNCAGCGGVISVAEEVRRFDISIRQVGEAKDKQCVYHLRAPPGKRILINIIRVGGRCLEGCGQDMTEFKMKADYRAVGYRICCQVPRQRRILSRVHMVPFMVTSRYKGMSLAFEYTHVDANVRFDNDEASTRFEVPREEGLFPEVSKNLDLMPELSTKDTDVEITIHQKR